MCLYFIFFHGEYSVSMSKSQLLHFFYSCLFSSTALITHLGVYDVYHFFIMSLLSIFILAKVHNKSHVDVSFILAKVHSKSHVDVCKLVLRLNCKKYLVSFKV